MSKSKGIKEKAKELVVIHKFSFAKAAKEVGVAASSVHTWAKDGNWQPTPFQIKKEKRAKAKELVLLKGYSVSDAAKVVDLSEIEINELVNNGRGESDLREILQAKKDAAKELVVIKGYSQKKAAKEVGVSKTTICQWAKKDSWDNDIEKEVKKQYELQLFLNDFYLPEDLNAHTMEVKRYFANYLITVKNFTQKQVSEILNLSETTLTAWNKFYGWRAMKKGKPYPENTIYKASFEEFLKTNKPEFYRKMLQYQNEFFKTVSAQFDELIEKYKDKQ